MFWVEVIEMIFIEEIIDERNVLNEKLNYLNKLKDELNTKMTDLKERIFDLRKELTLIENLHSEIVNRILDEKGKFFKLIKEFNKEHKGLEVLKFDENTGKILHYQFNKHKRNKLDLIDMY